jgi:cytochrome c biogenesis protein CcdA
LTVAVFATGIALGIGGPGHHTLLELHKASFILWFGAMTIHVLGHLVETPRLAAADWTRVSSATAGRGTRVLLVVGALLLGLLLAFATRHWSTAWHHVPLGG